MFTKTGDSFLGFTVTRIRSSEELGGRLVELIYDKTGTPVCWVDNGQENKLFAVAFKTLPEDSTGVFHILEHSVLCGSAKYPVREPFVELLKSSMNTFLNAMTYPDKTLYPVSSRNKRDFLNLTEVYLDAVFAPRILSDPNIFYQEGWHIEQDENGTLTYKGVVFNEMKGAMSGPDRIAEQRVLEMLFPDNCYGFNSGGEPTDIPNLTYAQFCETYRRFYHPSNARIYLDGTVPMEETLTLIAEYLSQFEKSDNLPQLTEQKPVASRAQASYELSKDEPIENKGYLSVGKIVGSWRDHITCLAVYVLNDAIAGSNDTPLKRAVLSSGLAQEMSASLEISVAQPYLELDFRNIKDGSADELLALVRRTAAELADGGLDHAALEASANRLEFRFSEPEEPQALDRCTNALLTWLHGGDPMTHLLTRDSFIKVREMIAAGEFEALLRRLYVEEEGTAVLELMPSYTYGEELRADEAERLAQIGAAWSDADRAENLALNEKLLAWQQTPDTPEQLATLPVLPLSEVSPEPHFADSVIGQVGEVPLLFHKQPCRNIQHIRLYFRLTDFTLPELALAGMANLFFGKLSTAHYSALELQQKLKNTFGRFDISVSVSGKEGVRETCTPMLVVSLSVLKEKRAEAEELLREVLFRTDLRQKELMRERLIQVDERNKQFGIAAGHALGISVASARFSAFNAVSDALGGLTMLHGVRALVSNFDERFDEFASLLERIRQETLCRARMTVSLTAAEEADLSDLIGAFPAGTAVPEDAAYSISYPERAGYVIPAQIGFAVQGWMLSEGGHKYDSTMRVAAKILSLSYLWNVVRVQGGAYGTGLSVRSDGSVYTYSYRDPSPQASLEANKGFSGFIRAFCESDEPLDKFIISTVSDEEPLLSPRDEGGLADSLYFTGRTRETLREFRRSMLGCTRETLLEQCKIWDEFAEKGAVCVVAADSVLKKSPGLTVLD